MDSVLKWLWLHLVFGAGSKYISDIIYKYKNAENAFNKLTNPYSFEEENELKNCGFSQQIIRRINTTPLSQCEMLYNYCKQKNIDIVAYDDEYYPEFLRNLNDPPCVLFCVGNKELFKEKLAITVVGTRNPSEYSMNVAANICLNLAKDGFVIVSGFANGLDSMAHEAALKASGKTIAVLGCGIDYEYPKGSTKRKNDIVNGGGLIVSEYLPGTIPRPANFPKRNRILAAISLGTLVIQAAQKSGSLITANLALELGKDIFCIPPANIFDKTYEGVVKYLRDGAIPVFSHIDIVNAYYFNYAHTIRATNVFSLNENAVTSAAEDKNKAKVKKVAKEIDEVLPSEKTVETTSSMDLSDVDNIHKEILDAIDKAQGELSADELAELIDADFTDIMAALTELEITGRLQQLPGKIYKRK